MRKAQSTLEYILVVGALAASVIAMGAYINRGFQGRWRSLADQLGGQYAAGNTTIDNFQATETSSVIVSESKNTTVYAGSGIDLTTTTTGANKNTENNTQTVKRQALETMGNLASDYRP